MTRSIIIDTEVTGLSAAQKDKLTEIGALELVDGIPTGKTFHTYLNPERSVPRTATSVTGLTRRFLRNHPTFKEMAQEFLGFIKGDPLIIHNARFDLEFLNTELKACGFPTLKNKTTDTLRLARKKYPRERNTMDVLCARFKIDRNGNAEMPATLRDCHVLAQILKHISR